MNYETKRLKTGSRSPATTEKQRTKKNRKKQSVSQKIDLVMRIPTVQESSKSELSSRFFSRLKFWDDFLLEIIATTSSIVWDTFCFLRFFFRATIFSWRGSAREPQNLFSPGVTENKKIPPQTNCGAIFFGVDYLGFLDCIGRSRRQGFFIAKTNRGAILFGVDRPSTTIKTESIRQDWSIRHERIRHESIRHESISLRGSFLQG